MFKRIFKWIGLGLLSLILIALVIYAFLPKGVRDPMEYTFSTKTEKQLLSANEFAVVAGTSWSSQAGYQVLERGGNACDAAVGAIVVGENGELLAGADPREETTALGK